MITVDPSFLSPVYFELLLCNDVLFIYRDLTARVREMNSADYFAWHDGTKYKGVYYRRIYFLPFDLCLIPAMLLLNKTGSGPVLQVSADFMDDTFYALSKINNQDVIEWNQKTVVEAAKDFKPSLIPQNRIYKLTQQVVEKFPLNPNFRGDVGTIIKLEYIPPLFKRMASILEYSDIFPGRSSLLHDVNNRYVTNQHELQDPRAAELVTHEFMYRFDHSEYMNGNEIMSKFLIRISEAYLKSSYSTFGSYFSPLLHIVQSSGYGKADWPRSWERLYL